MLRVRRVYAEPETTPPPWRLIVPRLITSALLVVSTFSTLQATWAPADGLPWIVAGVVSSLAALAVAVYGPVKESQAVTQFTTFAAVLLAGISVLTPLSGAQRYLVTAVLLVVLVLILTEPTFARARQRTARWVVRLPGHRDIRDEEQWDDLLLVLAALSALGAIATYATDHTIMWWLISSAPYVLVGIFLAAKTVITNLIHPRVWQALQDAIAQYDPEFVVYTSRPDDASYQVTMWLPYLKQAGKRFLIVARTPEAAGPLADLTDVPVVMLRSQRSLEALLTPSLGAVFYVNASSGNNAMVRHSQITHVYLGHGDSDKPPSYNPTHAMYDRVFAAGQAAVDRYAAHGVEISPKKFVIVGRPQVTDVDVVPQGQDARPDDHGPLSVLYAPTWRGHVGATAFQSLPVGEKIVSALLERGARVIFRPHPFSYDFPDDAALIAKIQLLLSDDNERNQTGHVFGEQAERTWSVLECMNHSDAMVSDVSSVVSDYLYSGKPFAMVDVSEPVDEFIEHYPVARGAYVLDPELSNLDTVLDELLGDDPLRATRWATRSYYLGDFATDGYGDHFIGAVVDAVETGQANKRGGINAKYASDDGSESSGDSEASSNTEDLHDIAGDDDQSVIGTGVFAEAIRLSRAASRTQTVRTLLRALPVVVVCAIALMFKASWWSLVVFVVAALTSVGLVKRRRRAGIPLRSLYGNEKAPWFFMSLTLGSLAAVQLPAGSDLSWQVFVGLPSIAMLIAAGGFMLQYRGVFAAHLPGIRVSPRHNPMVLLAGGLGGLFVVSVTVASAVITSDLPSWWSDLYLWSLSTVAVLVGVVFILGVIQSWRSARDAQQLTELISDYAPKFAVYFGANSGAQYQFGMWAEYFDRIDRPYIVVVRAPGMLSVLESLTNAPVILRPTLRSLDEVDVPSLSTVFYVNNATRNTHMVERAQLVNVWLNHGDSEKPACYNPVHAIYNKIFSAGQAGIDRYERHGVHIPREKFLITGRPQVEHIAPSRDVSANKTRPTVLYAPTWVGPYSDTDVYSLPVAEELITRILQRDVRIIFRAHPLNYNQVEGRTYIDRVQRILAQDARTSGRDHVWGEQAEEVMSLVECFNESDAMICDISAVISDYLQSAKPFAVMAMGRSINELLTEVPAAQSGYVIPADLSNLDERLDDLLVKDNLREKRQEMRRYYLGDFPHEGYADHFLDTARAVIDAGRRP